MMVAAWCSIMAQPHRSVTLLARSRARSDDVEADSFEQPLVAPAVHPFTGAFAASEHTVAFGSKASRLAFPLHVVALALLLFLNCVYATSGTAYVLILLALGLGARIALHRWKCQAKAQQLGAIAWTISVACGSTSEFIDYCLDPKALCETAGDLYFFPLLSILFTLLNASHGMEFWHTASLAGLLLCDLIAVRTFCANSAPVNLAIVILVVTFGAGHFAQLLARHAFLRSERLEHDVHRLECLLTGLRGAHFPAVVAPTESSSARDSTTTASAPEQDDRSVLSAPAATDEGHNALPAGLVLRGCPPSHTSDPSTAGPSTAADPLYASGPLSASVPLSAGSRLSSQALLNAPATSNPGPDTHPTPRTPHPPLGLT